MAMADTSMSLTNLPSFCANARSAPSASMPIATDAFGAAPLNGAAYARSVSAGSGRGLSSASRSSGDAFSVGEPEVGVGAGALPRGAE
jgi:hypothetical protein